MRTAGRQFIFDELVKWLAAGASPYTAAILTQETLDQIDETGDGDR